MPIMPAGGNAPQLLQYIDLTKITIELRDEFIQYANTALDEGFYYFSKKAVINQNIVVPYEDWLKFLQYRNKEAQ